MDTKQLLDANDDDGVPSTIQHTSGSHSQSTDTGSDYPVLYVRNISSGPDEYRDILASASSCHITIKVYKQRWYLLFVFALLAFLQGGLCNVWTVIAQSAGAAFGWSNRMISLMQGWLFISFLVAMFPAAMFMDKKG